jgi:hypothetical protein
MANTTWRALITEAMKAHGESLDEDTIAKTLSDTELELEFDNGYGGSEGVPFTLWTEKRVYFPVVYDGAEWVASVPREPSGEKTEHVGGE